MDCAEIRYVVRDRLARHFTLTRDGVHLPRVHVRAHYPYLGNGGRIALKFGMFLETG